MRILAVFTIIANILTQEEYEHLFLLQPFSETRQNAIPSFHSKKKPYLNFIQEFFHILVFNSV